MDDVSCDSQMAQFTFHAKNKWDDGEILDPASGKVYDCKMWIEGGKLQLRGFIGWSVIGRSQTWLPYK